MVFIIKRPLFKKQWGKNPVAVNQENENRKVMISLKQFESVTNYCEKVTCRHQTMAQFFGEATDKCGDRCDGCTIGKQVGRELDCLGRIGQACKN
jgi:superfamily II DNA helicase RecQ